MCLIHTCTASNNLAFGQPLQGVMHTVVVYIFKAVQTIHSQGGFKLSTLTQVYSMTDHSWQNTFLFTPAIESYLMVRKVEMRHVEVIGMLMSHLASTNNVY